MSKKHIIDMTGRVVLITGGSRGLGRAMALGFAEAGADIIIASRRMEACERVAREVEALGRKPELAGTGEGHGDGLHRRQLTRIRPRREWP